MSFVTASLAMLGTLLVSVPILLHLLLKQQPKHQVFPALRFIRQTQRATKRRIQLRHWLLLALRCAAIGLLALAFARPSVASSLLGGWLLLGATILLAIFAGITAVNCWLRGDATGLAIGLTTAAILLMLAAAAVFWQLRNNAASHLLGHQEAPVAAVVVLDSAPHMLYRVGSQSCLRAAQDIGKQVLRQLPPDSEIAVIDSGATTAVFSVNRGAAEKAIESARVSYHSKSILPSIFSAIDLLDTAKQQRKEIYVFSNLSEVSWDGLGGRVAQRLASRTDMSVYVLDVGDESPRNVALGDVRLEGEHTTPNMPLRVEVELKTEGLAAIRNVEMVVEKPAANRPVEIDGQIQMPELELRNQQEIQVDANSSRLITFSLQGLQPGVHHGQVRIQGEDGLAVDDLRYFSIEVTESWPVLIVGGVGAETSFLLDALAPFEERATSQSLFQVVSADESQLDSLVLSDYAAIGLVDPGELPVAIWRRLHSYVEQGGGLATFLGRNAVRGSFNQPTAQAVLPGLLVRHWRAGDQNLYIATRDMSHPMLAAFRSDADNIPWREFPVFRHWEIDDQVPDAVTVLRFGNDKPAIVARRIGKGTSVMMATPVSDRLDVKGRPPWNLLPTAPGSWPFFVLSNEMFLHLVQSESTQLNYHVGQPAGVTVPTVEGNQYEMFVPNTNWQAVVETDGQVTVHFTDQPGVYRVRPTLEPDQVAGFSVNVDASATQLSRVDTGQFDRILGVGNYSLARDTNELSREVGEARTGSDLFPWIMIVVAAVLGLEHLLSNRFYTSPHLTT